MKLEVVVVVVNRNLALEQVVVVLVIPVRLMCSRSIANIVSMVETAGD